MYQNFLMTFISIRKSSIFYNQVVNTLSSFRDANDMYLFLLKGIILIPSSYPIATVANVVIRKPNSPQKFFERLKAQG